MPYNLFVSGNEEAWETNEYIFDRSRCIREYTSKELLQKYIKLEDQEIAELKKYPCIFAYEYYCNKDPIFGYITDVISKSNRVKICFTRIPLGQFFSCNDLSQSKFDLEIGEWELNRTHWAVKDVDLAKILKAHNFDLSVKQVLPGSPINITSHNFRISFSFPGEHRDYVEETYKELKNFIDEDDIFYDNKYKSQLARPAVDLLLQDIYQNRSDLIVVFLCEKYQEKLWCGIEFKSIRALIMRKENEKIMYVRLDDGTVEGVSGIDGYIDGRNHTPKEIAEFINERLQLL